MHQNQRSKSLPGLIARSKKGKKYEDDDIDRDSEMQRKRDGKVRTPRKFLKTRFTINQRGKIKILYTLRSGISVLP